MSKANNTVHRGIVAVMANNVACYQDEALRTIRKAKDEVQQLRDSSAQAQERLIALLKQASSNAERKVLAKLIATLLKEKKVDTGDLSSILCDIMKDAGVPIYPPPWPYEKW